MADRTPRSERLHIAIFGRRNAGKSSLINALTNQDIALVSEVPGTTTDPVYKAMEILPLGPVVLIDTAGLDDVGVLGDLRVQRTLTVMRRTDLALLVVDATAQAATSQAATAQAATAQAAPAQAATAQAATAQAAPGDDLSFERATVERLQEQKIPVLGVLNKIDLVSAEDVRHLGESLSAALGIRFQPVSTVARTGIDQLKMEIVRVAPADWSAPSIIGDLLRPGDMVVLVVPIDLAAPRGRLILPQVQTLRDILDHDACGAIVKERELRHILGLLSRPPRIVVTDSQVFAKVSADTPRNVWLTSFSILFARYKGDLPALVRGAKAIDELQPGDRVLIAEACTHHPVADDIGRVKIPRWMRQRVGGDLQIDVKSGLDFPENLRDYRLIVHCGGCMINRREMLYRIMQAQAAGVPIVNYGVAIAYLHGILPRVLEPFPAARLALEEG